MAAQRLCIVMPEFSGGGAERVGVNLANYLAEHTGIDVQFVVFNDRGALRDQVSPLVPVVAVPGNSRNPYFRLAATLRKLSPDSVLSMFRKSNAPLGLSRYFFNDYRLVLREANTLAAIRQKNCLRQWKNITKLRLAYRQADCVIANSEDALNELIAHRIVQPEQAVNLGNPVDIEQLIQRSGATIDHVWLQPDRTEKTILTAGRLHHQKNQALLLDGFAQALASEPNLRLILLGTGNKQTRLEQQAKRLGIEQVVDFAGFQTNPYPYFKAADAFCLTSRWEGFPNVLIEAMALGTPVVATNCQGACRDILAQGKAGQLVPENQPHRLASAILDAVHGRVQAQTAYARERIQQYTQPVIARDYARALGLTL